MLLVVFSSRHWRLLSVGQLYTMLLFRNFCSYTEYTLMYPNLTFLKWYTRYFEKKRSYYSFILFIISLGIKVGTFLFVYLFFKLVYNCFGFPWWLSGKESACQSRRCGYNPWVRQISWGRKSHGQRSLAGYRS